MCFQSTGKQCQLLSFMSRDLLPATPGRVTEEALSLTQQVPLGRRAVAGQLLVMRLLSLCFQERLYWIYGRQ